MKPFPRRRDVRVLLEEMFELLSSHLDSEYSDHGEYLGTFFDRPFLDQVRDMMRDGLTLEDALRIVFYEEKQSADEPQEEEFTDYPGLRHAPEFQG